MSGLSAAIVSTALLAPVPVQRPHAPAPTEVPPTTAPSETPPSETGMDAPVTEVPSDAPPAETTPTEAPTTEAPTTETTETTETPDEEVDDPGPAPVAMPTRAPEAVPARRRAWEEDEDEDPARAKPKRWPDPRRKGVLIEGGIGFARCGQDECHSLKAAAWFDFTGGYRFGRFAPILHVAGGRGPLDVRDVGTADGDVHLDTSTASLGFLYIGAGTLLHLVKRSRFDPYIGLTLGYFQSRSRVSGNGTLEGDVPQPVRLDFTSSARRGALGVMLGLGFLLGERWTLGPRFEAIVPFAGELCTHNFSAKPSCEKLSKTDFEVGQYFARPWTISLQVGVLI